MKFPIYYQIIVFFGTQFVLILCNITLCKKAIIFLCRLQITMNVIGKFLLFLSNKWVNFKFLQLYTLIKY